MESPYFIIEIEPPDIAQALRALSAYPRPFCLHSGLLMRGLGRYSILGAEPFMSLESGGGVNALREGSTVSSHSGNPFHMLRSLLRRFRIPPHERFPFAAGAVGYLSYDLCHYIERLPRTTAGDIGLPEMVMAFHDEALIVDHCENRAFVVAADSGAQNRKPAAYRANALKEKLLSPTAPTIHESKKSPGELLCNFTREDYLKAIQRCKDYIAAGDIFQVNLSRRFEASLNIEPVELFLRLCRINPAPMAAYMGIGDGAVVSASPERFLKVDGRRVETRPIKGTRPRGKSASEDRALAAELLASEKDNAELAMIVDLERNDLGRVCSYGSVRVTEARRLESFPTVHHLVATVEGTLHGEFDIVDLLKASFPGGSITGAPKIRAMQIIDELEPTRRSVYTGAAGYIGFDGRADLNIVIRTILVKGGKAWFQAGGGIVADSCVEDEYEETYHKARALMDSVNG